MPIPAIVDFRQTVDPDQSVPEPGKRISGEPRLSVWNHYSDPGGRFFAGNWSSGVGCWRVAYTEHEFCHLLEGRVLLRAEDGREWRFGPGDAFVIPAGFAGSWESLDPVRKRYAIFEPGS